MRGGGSLSDGFLSRIEMAAGTNNTVRHSEWVTKYTMLNGAPFSFKDHEMQQAIFDDLASRMFVKKPSQVGISEMMVRKILTISGVMKYVKTIYTLPTRQMAQKFSKDRIDSAINQSEVLKGLVKTAANSTEQKIFTNDNALYVSGTVGATTAISIPANVVISDESDFSDQETLSKLSSRLRHAPMNPDGLRGFRYYFSTPTLPNFGISEGFETGDQKYYMCKCLHCGHWSAPNWYRDFVVPGFDDDITELDKNRLLSLMDRYDMSKTYIKCEKCGKDLLSSLLNVEGREWVKTFENRVISSYQISPWDVPVYNSPYSILTQMTEYRRTMDYYNFVLGLEYEDADAIFLEEFFYTEPNSVWERYIEQEKHLRNIITKSVRRAAGMDVGKILHLTITQAVGKYTHLVWAEEIHHTAQKPAKEQVLHRFAFYGVRLACVDSGPDITLVRQLTEEGPAQGTKVYAVEYVTKVKLQDFEVMGSEPIVKANRTETLKSTMKEHNLNLIRYPAGFLNIPVLETFKKQVTAIKKIDRELDGELVEAFAKTGPDHFGHSLNYCRIAQQLLISGFGSSSLVPVLPQVTGIKMKTGIEDDKDPFAPVRGSSL